MIFGKQQENAIRAVDHWLKNDTKSKPWFYLAGFAGTGKTTIAKHMAELVGGDVIYASFTGKASLRMRQVGCEGASTIHSLLYVPKVNEKTGEVHFKFNKDSVINTTKLVIIDECSMVDDKLAADLLWYKKPILVLGDPAQLPPVNGEGFFTRGDPDILLTEIHRQAKENPIIWMATKIREGGSLSQGNYGSSKVTSKYIANDVVASDQIIVGRNLTKDTTNNRVRTKLGFTSEFPEKGEKIICLSNVKDLGFFNGGMYDVVGCKDILSRPGFMKLHLFSLDEEYEQFAIAHKYLFSPEFDKPDWKMLRGTQEFDFAYAITCHKAQGSQWDNVYVNDESFCFREKSASLPVASTVQLSAP